MSGLISKKNHTPRTLGAWWRICTSSVIDVYNPVNAIVRAVTPYRSGL